MAKRKTKKRKQETPKVVEIIERVESVESVETVEIEVNVIPTTQAPTTTVAPVSVVNTDKAKLFLQSVQEKQIEQIHDWLDSIEESMMLTKDILNNTTNNKEESFALKRIQKLYHQLNLIKNIKKGKTVIMGFNKKKLKN